MSEQTAGRLSTRGGDGAFVLDRLRALLRGRNLAVLGLILLLGFLTVYPMSMLLYGSLHSTPPGTVGEFNLDGYRQIMTAHNAVVLLNTIGISFAKTVPSLAVAILLAWIVARTDTPLSRRARSADHAAVLRAADPHRDGVGHARQPAGRRDQPDLAGDHRLGDRRRSTSIPMAA